MVKFSLFDLRAPQSGLQARATGWGRAARTAGVCLGAAGLMGLLPGCGSLSPFAPEPTEIDAKLVAAAQVNLDSRKRPSPVVVRVYELKARTQFDGADFLSLFERDKEVLGSELLMRDEFVLRPGETKDLARQPQPESKFLAVVVGFRDMEKSRPRAIVAIEPNKVNRWTIKVDALTVGIAPAEPPK
ncbi:MAG: type secretion system lipoprotein TssJ [Pseudomonadota bacterium]|jgi:type VI secretion system protein VasD